ncbi:MAG: hypothetical protein AAB632_00420 [Patescibacteria group bacterium]
MTDTIQKEKTDVKSTYEMGLRLLKSSYKSGKIFTSLPKSGIPLSHFDFLSLPALPSKDRKKIVKKFLSENKILNIGTTGVFSWAIINTIKDYNDNEKLLLEKYFTECEEYFDCKVNAEGLLPTDVHDNWLGSADRIGILIENQAYHAKILDVLFLITEDDMYDFKKRRLMRAARNRLDGAYVLDKENSMDVRPNVFIAAFFAPELFMSKDWQKTFDASLKSTDLWLNWGGLTTLGQSDVNFNPERDGESWFFVNNMAAIVLHRLDSGKYAEKIKAILRASTENAAWQEHTGRPCEVVFTMDKQIKARGLYGLSIATFIYLYRIYSS